MFTLYNILKLIMMIIHAYIFGNIYIYIYIYYHISTSKRVVYPYQISTNYSNSTRYNSIIIFKKWVMNCILFHV